MEKQYKITNLKKYKDKVINYFLNLCEMKK